jgi:hypothetical protein
MGLVGGRILLFHTAWPESMPGRWQWHLERAGQWGIWFFILLTTAMTMALIWKTKEVIFRSVFTGTR